MRFKKLIDFKNPFNQKEQSPRKQKEDEESSVGKESQEGQANISHNLDIEERIHINYRL